MNEDSAPLKPESSVDRLRRFLEYEERFGVINCARCVELAELQMHLSKLSSGAQQWVSSPISIPNCPDPRYSNRWLIIGYSNPDTSAMPNHIVFCFPVLVGRAGSTGEERLLVCLGVDSATPLSEGLYWKDDELDIDWDEDWKRFYDALSKGLWTSPDGDSQNDLLQHREQGMIGSVTIAGIPWRPSVTALVTEWADSPERVLDEILCIRY